MTLSLAENWELSWPNAVWENFRTKVKSENSSLLVIEICALRYNSSNPKQVSKLFQNEKIIYQYI